MVNIPILTTRGTPLRYPSKQRMGNKNAFGSRWKLKKKTKTKMGLATKKRWSEGVYRYSSMGIGKTGHREDIGHFVRSTWEANVARLLQMQGIEYEYEPRSFLLPGGRTYRPDFYLIDQNLYLEIKGYDTPEAKVKRILTRKKYGVTIIVIGSRRYRRIMREATEFDDHVGFEFE